MSGIIREIALLGGVVLLVHEAVLNPKNLLQGRVMRVTEIAEGDREDNDIDASSPNRNQVVNVYDTPSDNRGWEDLPKEHQQIAFYAKKCKPDDSLLMNF